ncbi:MAG TPA: hypothetical protein ENJ75_03160 [Candidatus Kaiserbacteria bacterium]|nr:hypothetical protein [Candidatus Kaiserbacteria bacterium]
MKSLKENWSALIATLFLFGALLSWPYSYFQLLRWVVCGIGLYRAYQTYESERIGWTVAFGLTAVLFNPIAPFYLQKGTWQFFDVVATLIFLVSIFIVKNQKDSR